MTWSWIVRNAVMGLVVLVLLPWAVAQQGGQKSKDTGNTSRGNVPVTPAPKTQPDLSRPPRQILFISGKVVQEEENPLPFGTVIERNCNGRVKRETTVDSAGYFSFQVGGDRPNLSDLLPDASDDPMAEVGAFGGRRNSQNLSSGPGSSGTLSLLMGCELRARLGGYRSSTVILQGLDTVGQLDVGTIVLYPISKVPGTLVSATNMGAPKEAQKALERAQKALRKDHVEEAEKDLKTAIELYPKYATAWFELGHVYQQQQRIQDARAAYDSALKIDKNYVSPYIQLARLAGMEQKWQEVADITDQALALDPLDFPDGYFYNSVAYFNLGNLDAAERSARKTQRLDGLHRFPQAHLIMANILEKKQDITGTIEQLQEYLKFAPKAENADKVRSRLEELQRSTNALANKQPVRE